MQRARVAPEQPITGAMGSTLANKSENAKPLPGINQGAAPKPAWPYLARSTYEQSPVLTMIFSPSAMNGGTRIFKPFSSLAGL